MGSLLSWFKNSPVKKPLSLNIPTEFLFSIPTPEVYITVKETNGKKNTTKIFTFSKNQCCEDSYIKNYRSKPMMLLT